MGHKVNPIGLRLGINRTWDAKWFATREYKDYFLEDIKIRETVKQKYYHAGIPRIEIERLPGRVRVIVHASRPGIIIGRGGTGIEELRKTLADLTGKTISITIQEVKNPDLEAQLLAENVAFQIEKRVAYRRAMKHVVARALKAGAKGVKVSCSGRLAGAEIARSEWYREGSVPLQRLRADIDYGFAEAMTTYGKIGVKVWIYRGDVIEEKKVLPEEELLPEEEGVTTDGTDTY
ncbi:30S ribosomal protein S3 [bacterium]|nr:30S ribosomal protein S3 [bacterium]